MTKNAKNIASAEADSSIGLEALKTIAARTVKKPPTQAACFKSVIGQARTTIVPIIARSTADTEAIMYTALSVSLLSKFVKMFFITFTAFAVFLLPTILYTINFKKSREVMA